MDKPAPTTNLNNNLPPKRGIISPSNVKLLNISQEIVQEDENIIDDINAYFGENNINTDDEWNLDHVIEHNDENIQQDLKLSVAPAVNITLANSYYTDNIPTITNNTLVNKDHHNINYNTILTQLSHRPNI